MVQCSSHLATFLIAFMIEAEQLCSAVNVDESQLLMFQAQDFEAMATKEVLSVDKLIMVRAPVKVA